MILNLLLVEREVGGRKKGGISVPCSVFRVPCSAFRVPRFGVERFSGTAQLVALPLLILNHLLVERELGGRLSRPVTLLYPKPETRNISTAKQNLPAPICFSDSIAFRIAHSTILSPYSITKLHHW